MKTRFLCSGLGLASLLWLSGCGHSGPSSEKPPPMQIEGVNVDTGQLAVEFTKAAPEIQSKVNDAILKLRYRQYVPSMMELDELSSNTALTDPQKKILTQVIGQLKEVAAKNPGN